MNETVAQDLVCELPEEVAIYKRDNGKLPEMEFEPGYICSWDNRYFVHTRATFPLHDIDNGVGFGLWVEIAKEDYDKYLAAETDDEKYMAFESKGMVANYWPGFKEIYGLIVTIKAINVTEKIYIWEINNPGGVDRTFDEALMIKPEEKDKIETLRKKLFS